VAGAAAGVSVWQFDRGGKTVTHAVVRTVNGQASTVTVTTPTSPPAATPDTRSPSQLNDAGYALLLAGNAQQALPLLERAVAGLQGSGSLTEAYASYNLAWARFAVGQCDGVTDLLDRSQSIQGHRKEIDQLRKDVAKLCESGGDGKGNGNGHGKD
jgi:hypothetical protein